MFSGLKNFCENEEFSKLKKIFKFCKHKFLGDKMDNEKYVEATWILKQRVKKKSKKEGEYEYYAIRLPKTIIEKLGTESFKDGAVAVWKKIDAENGIIDAELTIIPMTEARKKGIIVVPR